MNFLYFLMIDKVESVEPPSIIIYSICEYFWLITDWIVLEIVSSELKQTVINVNFKVYLRLYDSKLKCPF